MRYGEGMANTITVIEQLEWIFEKKEIEILEAIKTEGNHFIDVKLDKGFSGRVKVKVKGI